MSARTMALKAATRGCQLNKIPNTRLGSRLDPGFNYVNLTDDQLRTIRIRKGYGITYKQRHTNLKIGRCTKTNIIRGEYNKNTHETWDSSKRTDRLTAQNETPAEKTLVNAGVKSGRDQGEVLYSNKGSRVIAPIIPSSTYKTITSAKSNCNPELYRQNRGRGRAGTEVVKNNRHREPKDHTRYKTGQQRASATPPITVTKCIQFSKPVKRTKPQTQTQTQTQTDTIEICGEVNGFPIFCSDGIDNIGDTCGPLGCAPGGFGAGANITGSAFDAGTTSDKTALLIKEPGPLKLPFSTSGCK